MQRPPHVTQVEPDPDTDVVVVVTSRGPVAVIRSGIRRRRVEIVGVGVVDERRPDGHPLGDLCQHHLGLAENLKVLEGPIVPMVAAAEVTVAERVLRIGDVHGAEPFRLRGDDGVAVVPIPDLVVPATSNEVVRGRVERKQDADPPFRIRVQHQEMSVSLRAYVHSDSVPELQLFRAIEPDLQGWVLLRGHGRRRGFEGHQTRHQ
jgi:hypothetical protein